MSIGLQQDPSTAYYLESVLHTDPDQINGLGEIATQLDFAKLLSLVSGDLLEPINDVATFPDCKDHPKDTVQPLYQAGILSSVDAYGTFNADGYAIVRRDSGCGVIDTTGKLIIPCQWTSLRHRGGPLFYSASIQKDDGVWLFADGKPVSEDSRAFGDWNITLSNGYFPCTTHYMDINFQPVTPQIFDWTGPVDENGYAFAEKDGTVYRIALN